MDRSPITRRAFLAAAVLAPVFLYPTKAFAASRAEPTPACGAGTATPPQTEGPFFKPRSPERKSLVEPGVQGAAIVVEGRVLSTGCRPVAGALVDFWQADASGAYDNSGFKLRGHQFTDGAGRYRLETIVPGLYPGRTRHFHVRVQAPDRPVLTTQLYFPGEPGNRRDGIFNPRLLLELRDSDQAKTGRFDFLLDLG
ncbi:MAG TPA: intradiol ring-cleavage dioxygenase [Candidatus Binatia bacterium]